MKTNIFLVYKLRETLGRKILEKMIFESFLPEVMIELSVPVPVLLLTNRATISVLLTFGAPKRGLRSTDAAAPILRTNGLQVRHRKEGRQCNPGAILRQWFPERHITHSLHILPFAACTQGDDLHFGREWDAAFGSILTRVAVFPSAASLNENRKQLLPRCDFSRLQRDGYHFRIPKKLQEILRDVREAFVAQWENKAVADNSVRREVEP